jgi:2-hydroxy fatty acid dioxygenase
MCSLNRLVRLLLATLSPFHKVNTRSFQAFLAPFHLPPFGPAYHHVINDYMVFETNYASLMGAVYIVYYLLLEPVAAVSFFVMRPYGVISHLNHKLLYAPQMVVIVLTATAFGQNPSHTPVIIAIHVACWIAQFLGHGLAEKRAPALLDNLLGGKTLFLITG